MANGYQDNTSNASFIPTIVAQKALGYFAANMNLAKTVSTNFDWSSATEGATIQVPKRGALTVNSKSSNSNVTVQKPTATNVSVTLNNHFEVTFGIDDVTAVLQNQNTLIGYAEDAAKVLAESIETTVAGQYANLTATAITFDGTSASTIDASVRAIRKFFTDQKVPVGEQRNVMVSSGVYNALLSVPEYVQAQNIGLANRSESVPIITGNVLPLFGMNFWEGQLVPQTGSSAPFTDHNIAYTKNALVLASRPLPSVGQGQGAVSEVIADANTGLGLRAVFSYNPNQLAHQITLDVLLGASVIDARRAVEVDFAHS